MSLIRNDYIITPYRAGKWILEISGQHFIINTDTEKLVKILSTAQNYEAAAEMFNSGFKNNNVDENEFIGFIEKVFKGIPIFDQAEGTSPNKSFINFQHQLLNPVLAGKMASFIMFLFNKTFFWIAFILLSVLGLSILSTTSLSLLGSISPVWILVLYTPTIFLHELGHVASCKKFTGRNGEVGFGIYFIFPVLYSNISSIWHAGRNERVITNLAGIYMQLWCMLVFYGIYLFTRNDACLYLAFIITIYSFIQIIPFIRSDGYWLLSDISSVPNLHEKSRFEVRTFLARPFQWIKEVKNRNIFLLLYGAFNTFVFLYFIVTQIVYHWKEILIFPIHIISQLKQVFLFHFSEIVLPPNFITILVFYIFLVKNSISFFQKAYEAHKNKRYQT